jgi:hypothetical protein
MVIKCFIELQKMYLQLKRLAFGIWFSSSGRSKERALERGSRSVFSDSNSELNWGRRFGILRTVAGPVEHLCRTRIHLGTAKGKEKGNLFKTIEFSPLFVRIPIRSITNCSNRTLKPLSALILPFFLPSVNPLFLFPPPKWLQEQRTLPLGLYALPVVIILLLVM